LLAVASERALGSRRAEADFAPVLTVALEEQIALLLSNEQSIARHFAEVAVVDDLSRCVALEGDDDARARHGREHAQDPDAQ
jgi:hypothetical protein